MKNDKWKMTRPSCILLLLAAPIIAPSYSQQQNTSCPFNEKTLTYEGSALEQATCLLRPVKIRGELGEPLKKLPDALEKLIGQRVRIDVATLRRYLEKQNIDEADIGGSLSSSLSSANNGAYPPTFARYFIIHDVSTPNYLDAPLPANINDETWEWNDLKLKWSNTKVAHVFISRTGHSLTAVDFGSTLPERRFGTKFARDFLKENGKGLQLHVELIQPRRRDPSGPRNNDAIAPSPGFTEAQMDRLALVYMAASVRRGEWLIPAFHAAVDAGIPDAHDDPQNFDLRLWAESVNVLLRELQKKELRMPVKVLFRR
ncbi:MAG: hypothetical protein ACREBG_25230 [Pyrinomonadaceae bacterium]